MKRKEQKRLAKKILEESEQHPDWYTEAEVTYATKILNTIRQNKLVEKILKQVRKAQGSGENTY